MGFDGVAEGLRSMAVFLYFAVKKIEEKQLPTLVVMPLLLN